MLKDAVARRGWPEGAAAFDSLGGDHHHFAGFNLADEFGTDDVQRAGFRAQRPRCVTDFAQHKRADTQRIAHANQLGACHGHDGKGPFDPAQGVFHPVRNRPLERTCHQMDDAFAV